MKTSNTILFTAMAILIVLMTAVAIVFKVKSTGFTSVENGNKISREINLESFNRISVEGGFQVEYTVGNDNKLVIEADSSVMERIETSVSGNTLRIHLSRSSGKRIVCKLNAPVFEGLSVSAGGRFSSEDTLVVSNFEVNASAGSVINLIGKFGNVETDASSGSRINLAGTGEKIIASASSGSTNYFADMEANYAKLEASSGASIRINAKELEASASSGASIRYKEGGIIKNVESSSGGSIKSY
jgi:hypothetical protein